jgi:beta-ureidopropionase
MTQQFASVEESLKKHLPEEDRKEVFRILYGRELEYFLLLS